MPIVQAGDIIARTGNYSVSTSGRIFEQVPDTSLPELIIGTDKLLPGDVLTGNEIKNTLAILALLKKNGIAVRSIYIYTKEYCVLEIPNQSGTIRVLYNENSNPTGLISSLQSIVSVFTIEGKVPDEVDFRFDKPVLRYNK